MKQKIIEFFQQGLPSNKSEQFNKLFELYRNSLGKSLATERMLNSSGYSKTNLEALIYDIKRLHGIKDVELVKKQAQPLDLPQLTIADKIYKLFQGIVPEEILIPTDEEKIEINNWDYEKLSQCFIHVLSKKYVDDSIIIEKAKSDVPEFVELLEKASQNLIPVSPEQIELAKKLEVVSGEKDSLQIDLENSEDEKSELEGENEFLKEENETLALELAELKKTESEHNGKLRDEFEFLNDAECPDIAHVLVGRKLAAWKRYQANHEKLQLDIAGNQKLSAEEKLEATKASVEDFTENQAIYDELNHYKENKEFLKKHPLFRTTRLKEEVEGMTPEELIAYTNSSAKYFSVKKSAMAIAEKAKNEAKIIEISEGVTERQEKLALVNKKLGVGIKK
jgi:hypothetical protein